LRAFSPRHIAEQLADYRQPSVASPDAVSALALEVIEEGAEQRRVEIVKVEHRALLAGALGGELEQQALVSR
jgi:hypothetical protein